MRSLIVPCILLFVVVGCARDQEMTPAERERMEFLHTPAPVRIAFEKEHPNAQVREVNKRTLPDKIMVWEIQYTEDGRSGTATYRSNDGPPPGN